MDNIDCDNYDKPKLYSEPLEESSVSDIYIDTLYREDKIRMLRKLMLSMVASDIDDIYVKDTFNTMLKSLDNYESIDKEMVAKLKSIFSNDVIIKDQYADIIKAIEQGSTVVYFKSAQLFKVYKKTELKNSDEQLNEVFIEYDDIYQVIGKKHKQKITIETDLTLLPNIVVFINYIAQFMKTLGFETFDETYIGYIETKSLVFTINGYYVKNSKEKQRFIEKLIKFVYKQYKYKDIVNTINIVQHCEFDKCEQFEIISLTNSLTDVENCKYIFEPKQLPKEVITNHNNVYIFTDHDWQQQLRKNFKRGSQWVYFIQDASGIKIGMTKKLKDRKSSLQTGNSHKLEIIAYIESENMSDLEKSFHQHLKPLSIIGEWFKLDKEKTVKMLRGCRDKKISYDF